MGDPRQSAAETPPKNGAPLTSPLPPPSLPTHPPLPCPPRLGVVAMTVGIPNRNSYIPHAFILLRWLLSLAHIWYSKESQTSINKWQKNLKRQHREIPLNLILSPAMFKCRNLIEIFQTRPIVPKWIRHTSRCRSFEIPSMILRLIPETLPGTLIKYGGIVFSWNSAKTWTLGNPLEKSRIPRNLIQGSSYRVGWFTSIIIAGI